MPNDVVLTVDVGGMCAELGDDVGILGAAAVALSRGEGVLPGTR